MKSARRIVRMLRKSTLQALASSRKKLESDDAGLSLVVAPHPDDETFGCGGRILQKAQKSRSGGSVHTVFLTSGDAAHRNCCGMDPRTLGEIREGHARNAARILGVADDANHFLRLGDGKLPRAGTDDFEAAVDRLAERVEELQPREIYCPHPLEGWSDHVAAEEITRAAVARGGRGGKRIAIYHYCVWFWISMPLRKAPLVHWRDAGVLDIGPDFERKKAAIGAYLAEVAPCGVPYCGNLPPEFLRAFEWKKELFFRVDKA